MKDLYEKIEDQIEKSLDKASVTELTELLKYLHHIGDSRHDRDTSLSCHMPRAPKENIIDPDPKPAKKKAAKKKTAKKTSKKETELIPVKIDEFNEHPTALEEPEEPEVQEHEIVDDGEAAPEEVDVKLDRDEEFDKCHTAFGEATGRGMESSKMFDLMQQVNPKAESLADCDAEEIAQITALLNQENV